MAEAEFEKLWSQGQLSGWEDASKENGEGEGIWCAACKSPLGLNVSSHITDSLMQGQKMYAKQTVFDAHLKSKKHIKAAARSEDVPSSTSAHKPNGTNGDDASPAPASTRLQSKLYPAARYTALIQPLLVPLLPVLAETKSNVERRFSLTSRERELELQAAAAPPSAPGAGANGAPAEEEEEEERIYNPLKLPLGWDGKPIPYWLYKLHGLGVEYRCEICSDGVYMGRYVPIPN